MVKIAVISKDEGIRKMFCKELEKYEGDISEEYSDVADIGNIRDRCPDAVAVSVCTEGTELIDGLARIRDALEGICVFIIGNSVGQASYLYTYRCDQFIDINSITEDVRYCIDRVKNCSRRKKLRVSAFGRFEVFCGSEVVNFRNKKARELFALCIDHAGKLVTIDEAADKLWSDHFYDENVKQLYRRAVKCIAETLASVGADDVFVRLRGACRVNKDRISCDYFRFLENPAIGRELFSGEYMFDYYWSEATLAKLCMLCDMPFLY